MVVVTQLPNGMLSVKAHYFYRNRIRSIPTAVFNSNNKEWLIESFMLGLLEEKFPGELVYKTPRWVILNEPAPDMSQMYTIKRDIKLPKLKLNLYDYQQFGVRFMVDKLLDHGFVINADSVGTGKTVQAINVLQWFLENKGAKKILVVCKKSIKKQWQDEIAKFTDWDSTYPGISVAYTVGTPKQRQMTYDTTDACQYAVLITNYHTVLNDYKQLEALGFDFVVIDEAHVVKARTGKLNNSIAKLCKGKPVVFLTGTPVMSRPEDIFGIIQIADPSYFGSYLNFSREYLVIDTQNKYGAQIVGAKNLDKLREKVQDIVIRRTEFEVSVQLPSVIMQKKECEMDSTQEKILLKIQEKQDEIGEQLEVLKIQSDKPYSDMTIIGEKRAKLEAASKSLIAARQAASTDPRMFLRSNSALMKKEYGSLIPASYKMSSKSEALIETLEDILSNGDKVILFTKFRTCAEMVAEDIQKATKESVLMYTGQVSEEQRNNALDLFRNTSTYNILIGTEAMAEGVNAQVAKYIINVDQPDTLAIKTQRIGRARRVGSKFNHVVVYDMITLDSMQAKSKDVERLANIEKNRDLTDALVDIDEAQRQALVNAMKG